MIRVESFQKPNGSLYLLYFPLEDRGVLIKEVDHLRAELEPHGLLDPESLGGLNNGFDLALRHISELDRHIRCLSLELHNPNRTGNGGFHRLSEDYDFLWPDTHGDLGA